MLSPDATELIAQTLSEVFDVVCVLSSEKEVVNIYGKHNGNSGDDDWVQQLIANNTHIIDSVFEGRKTVSQCYRDYSSGTDYTIKIIAPPHNNLQVYIAVCKIEKTPVSDEATIWRLALDAAGEGIWDLNTDTGTMTFSDRWYDIFGFDRNQVNTMQDWTSLVHPDDLERATSTFLHYATNQSTRYYCEIRYKSMSGEYKWILSQGIIAQRDKDGKPFRFVGTHTDIHDRKILEEEHKANAKLLTRLIDNMDAGLLVTDEHKKIIFVNQAFCKLYGISARPYELKGLDTAASLEEHKLFYKNPDELTDRINEILKDGKAVFGEELEMKDGRIISRDYLPLSFDHTDTGEMWWFKDITEKKTIEARFEKQRLFYELLLNNIPADIAVHDKNHKFLFINPSAIKDDELRAWLIGKGHEDYCAYRNLPLSIAEERNARFRKMTEDKKPLEWEEKVVNRQGETTYHIRCLYPVFDDEGEIDVVIVYGVNITARIQAEQALATSMSAFANSFNFSGIGKALLSPAGKWLEVNDVVCRITGYSRNELLTLSHRDITYPADEDIDAKQITALLEKTISSYSIEKRFVCKNGLIIVTSLTVSLVWDADNAPKYFVCDIVDITKTRQLAEEVQRKNRELESIRDSLVNKINQLEELTGIVGHNLRGPAANIRMLSGILVDKDPEKAFSKDEAANMIYESSISLMNNLETVMDIVNIKLNEKLAYNDCLLPEIINTVCSQLQGIIFEKSAIITVDLGNITSISYPRIYLESILYNFISNALKYSRKDVKPQIVVTVRQENNRYRISVKDNGLGIDLSKYGNRIFKLNQIFHNGYDSKGIGLYMTRSQVESLGGSITVTSTVDEGSEFSVLL